MEKGFIYDKQDTLFGDKNVIGFGTDDFYIMEVDRELANKIIIENHYSGKIYNATYIHLGVFILDKLIGILQYGYAMNPASASSVVANTEIDEYLELNRMWLSDEAGKNSESKAISYSIKYIKKRFPKIKWIQSFADERCGCFGIVYQACSFKYYGEHDSIFWEYGNEIYHNSLMTRDRKLSKAAAFIQDNKENAKQMKLRQFRYIKYIDKRCIKDCLLEEKPYLKYYNGD